jgi:hypothetical protein
MLVKLILGFVYTNVILDSGESSYPGVDSGYHDQMRRMALVKTTHIVHNSVSQPQSYSIPLVKKSFLLFLFTKKMKGKKSYIV